MQNHKLYTSCNAFLSMTTGCQHQGNLQKYPVQGPQHSLDPKQSITKNLVQGFVGGIGPQRRKQT